MPAIHLWDIVDSASNVSRASDIASPHSPAPRILDRSVWRGMEILKGLSPLCVSFLSHTEAGCQRSRRRCSYSHHIFFARSDKQLKLSFTLPPTSTPLSLRLLFVLIPCGQRLLVIDAFAAEEKQARDTLISHPRFLPATQSQRRRTTKTPHPV